MIIKITILTKIFISLQQSKFVFDQVVARDYNSTQQSETHFSCDMQRKKPVTTLLFAQIFFTEKRKGLILERVHVPLYTHTRAQRMHAKLARYPEPV